MKACGPSPSELLVLEDGIINCKLSRPSSSIRRDVFVEL